MLITINVTVDTENQADVARLSTFLIGSTPIATIESARRPNGEKVAEKKQPTETTSPSAAADPVVTSTTATSPSAPSATTSPSDVTLETLTKVTKSFGVEHRPLLLEILGHYKVAKASLIPKDLWTEYVAKCEAALAAVEV